MSQPWRHLRRLLLAATTLAALLVTGSAGAAVVPAAPTGPAAPTSGWAAVYADGFGACIPGVACGLPGAPTDNTLGPVSHKNGAGNSNEIAGLMPSAVSVGSGGLDLHCASASQLSNPYGDPDTCGSVTGGAYSASAPSAFTWTPTRTTRFVLEASIQMPPNQGNMDPSFWSNGPADQPEVDHPELWGMSHPVPAGAANTWKGYLFGDPAVPFDSGGATGNVQLTWGTSACANLDPSLGLHTWTLDESGYTFTSYLDGCKLGSRVYSPFNTSSHAFKLLLMASMRKDRQTGKDYPLPSGGNDLVFRYVAVYAPVGQGTAGTGHAGVVPGTVVQ